jgi:HNH endonuclease
MPAYQLTYNPAKSNWDGEKEDWWACYTKNVQPDDEVYLIRLGQVPEAMKGIIGWGTATTAPYYSEGERRVNFRLSVAARKHEPPLVPLSILEQFPGNQSWSHRRSGIEIKPEALEALLRVRASHDLRAESGPARRDRALAQVRPGQLAFSAAVRERFSGRCVLSGLGECFSVAAHIIDYTKCENAEEQDDPHNGLFLAGHLHLAFDGNLFGLRPDGLVVWSRRMDPGERASLGPLQEQISVSPRSRPYLERRWMKFQESEGVPNINPAKIGAS